MRRRVTLYPALIAAFLLVAVGAKALDVKTGMMAKQRPSGALANFTWKAARSEPFQLPSGVSLYTVDGSKFYFKRVGVDSTFIPIPASNSILIPRGGAYVSGDSLCTTVLVAAHADSIIALPWGE